MALVDLKTAVDHLRSGGLVGLPTETVYGLAGRFDREATLRAIFTTKGRPFFDPLIVHVADVAGARTLSHGWTDVHERLAQNFWPGPLTLVVPRTRAVSDLITSGLDTVGLRCPRHPLALDVLRETGPLAAPSANRFGRTSPTRADDVELEFAGRIATLDGGSCEVGVESTVVLVDDGRIDVLRPGGVGLDELRFAVGPAFAVGRRDSVRSPGHLAAHYQPANPVVLVAPALADDDLVARIAGRHFAWLELPDRPELAARVLYGEFRRLSLTPGLILVRDAADLRADDWAAVYDRLRRAAGEVWA